MYKLFKRIFDLIEILTEVEILVYPNVIVSIRQKTIFHIVSKIPNHALL